MAGPYVYSDSYERRKDALDCAIEFAKDDDGTDSDDIVEIAKTFLEFLLKPE